MELPRLQISPRSMSRLLPRQLAIRQAGLIDWLEYMSKQARVIRIQVPDDANAYRIFETLNDRGLKLALSDLLRTISSIRQMIV